MRAYNDHGAKVVNPYIVKAKKQSSSLLAKVPGLDDFLNGKSKKLK